VKGRRHGSRARAGCQARTGCRLGAHHPSSQQNQSNSVRPALGGPFIIKTLYARLLHHTTATDSCLYLQALLHSRERISRKFAVPGVRRVLVRFHSSVPQPTSFVFPFTSSPPHISLRELDCGHPDHYDQERLSLTARPFAYSSLRRNLSCETRKMYPKVHARFGRYEHGQTRQPSARNV
jgi:hypothetical protein